MAKVLILGASGMLGSMVHDYFSSATEHQITGTSRQGEGARFDAETGDIDALLRETGPEFVINCIGVIKPYCKDDDMAGVRRAIQVNALFPHRLADAAGTAGARVIQIATDCVYSGFKGKYDEKAPHDALDVYGKTKSLGEVAHPAMLHIRCSIIGPERRNKASLLEWILGNPIGSTVKGFTHHRWNGITTLQFAHLCESIVNRGAAGFDALRASAPVYHFVPNETVTKYELLHLVSNVYGRDLQVEAVDTVGPAIDRSLATSLSGLYQGPLVPMREAVQALHDYVGKRHFYEK